MSRIGKLDGIEQQGAELFNKRDWPLLRIKLRRAGIEEATGSCYDEPQTVINLGREQICS